MSANDEFPRSLSQSISLNGPAVANVTYPAIPDLSWKLTAASWRAFVISTLAVGYQVQMQAVCDTITYPLGDTVMMNGAPVYTVDDGSWSGEITFPPNSVVTVGFAANNANVAQFFACDCEPV